MLTLYFSGTGNTRYIAKLFSHKMNAKCISIEANADFASEINAHDTIAFCYPIYCSRVPRNMREFVHKHMKELAGKKIIIFVTQMLFSGDGARVFTDMFKPGAIDVVYAEHFIMQQNMGNTFIFDFLEPNEKSTKKFLLKANKKINRICCNIKKGIVKKRGFSTGSKLLGFMQGKPWQKDTSSAVASRLEKMMQSDVKIHSECNNCNLCTKICPMKNLASENGEIRQQNNCIACYRCVNRCPQKAVTVFIHSKPKWQYHLTNSKIRAAKNN